MSPTPPIHRAVHRVAVATTVALACALMAGAPALAGPAAGAVRGHPQCDASFVPADAPNVATRVTDCPPGTTFTFAAGVYRLTKKIVPKAGDSLLGAGSGPGGTRFTGSTIINGWTKSGSMWVHTGDAKNVGVMPDPCDVGTACDYQDWLYRDGDWLARVLSPCTSLAAGQFCVDYKASKIFIGSDPGSSSFEYATVTQFLVGYRFGDVTAKHFSYDEFATVGGALQGGAGWLIDDVHGHHNHACGVSLLHSTMKDPATVENSTFDHNGYHGYCNPGDSPQILNDEIAFNNQLGFAHGTGMVLNGANGGLIQGNAIHDNAGVGIDIVKRGSDVGSQGIRILDNVITDNDGTGIRLFNACSVTVDSNTVVGNLGFGVDVQDANSNTVSNNTIDVPPAGRGGGIRIYADGMTGSNNCGALDDARDNSVTGNRVTMETVADHGNFGNVNGVVDVGGLIANEQFSANVYHVPGGTCSVTAWKWWDGTAEQTVGFSPWQASYRQDAPPTGTCGA